MVKARKLIHEGNNNIFSVEYAWDDEEVDPIDGGYYFKGTTFDRMDLLDGLGAGDKGVEARLVESEDKRGTILMDTRLVESEDDINMESLQESINDVVKRLGEPLHSDFSKIRKNMREKYGKDKGDQVYYAWVNKHGYDDTKKFPTKKTETEQRYSMKVTEKSTFGDAPSGAPDMSGHQKPVEDYSDMNKKPVDTSNIPESPVKQGPKEFETMEPVKGANTLEKLHKGEKEDRQLPGSMNPWNQTPDSPILNQTPVDIAKPTINVASAGMVSEQGAGFGVMPEEGNPHKNLDQKLPPEDTKERESIAEPLKSGKENITNKEDVSKGKVYDGSSIFGYSGDFPDKQYSLESNGDKGGEKLSENNLVEILQKSGIVLHKDREKLSESELSEILSKAGIQIHAEASYMGQGDKGADKAGKGALECKPEVKEEGLGKADVKVAEGLGTSDVKVEGDKDKEEDKEKDEKEEKKEETAGSPVVEPKGMEKAGGAVAEPKGMESKEESTPLKGSKDMHVNVMGENKLDQKTTPNQKDVGTQNTEQVKEAEAKSGYSTQIKELQETVEKMKKQIMESEDKRIREVKEAEKRMKEKMANRLEEILPSKNVISNMGVGSSGQILTQKIRKVLMEFKD